MSSDYRFMIVLILLHGIKLVIYFLNHLFVLVIRSMTFNASIFSLFSWVLLIFGCLFRRLLLLAALTLDFMLQCSAVFEFLHLFCANQFWFSFVSIILCLCIFSYILMFACGKLRCFSIFIIFSLFKNKNINCLVNNSAV